MADNPIIGCVEGVTYDFERDRSFVRSPHPGIGHQCYLEAISSRDAVYLLLDRASVGIDKNVQQTEILSSSVPKRMAEQTDANGYLDLWPAWPAVPTAATPTLLDGGYRRGASRAWARRRQESGSLERIHRGLVHVVPG